MQQRHSKRRIESCSLRAGIVQCATSLGCRETNTWISRARLQLCRKQLDWFCPSAANAECVLGFTRQAQSHMPIEAWDGARCSPAVTALGSQQAWIATRMQQQMQKEMTETEVFNTGRCYRQTTVDIDLPAGPSNSRKLLRTHAFPRFISQASPRHQNHALVGKIPARLFQL